MSTTRAFRTLSVITLALITAVALAAVIFSNRASAGDPTPASPKIPICELEDGSSQKICWWWDEPNDWYLNINYGESVYVPLTQELITW